MVLQRGDTPQYWGQVPLANVNRRDLTPYSLFTHWMLLVYLYIGGGANCERRDIIDLNRRHKLTHPESRAIIKVEEAFMKGARHDKEWDDTNDT